MPVSDTARRQHAALFPDHVSTLAVTDPELIDDWAFDEVLAERGPDTRTRLMLPLAAIIVCRGVAGYRVMPSGALEIGATPVEVREIVYQAMPYPGIGREVEFFGATNEDFTSRGIALPLPGQSNTIRENRMEQGLSAQKQIFGQAIDVRYQKSPADLLHIQRFLSVNCFGDYYTRGGLDLKQRELLTFAMLAAMGGCEPQLAGHVAGNLAMGNDREVLVGVLTQLPAFIGYPHTLNGLRVVNEGTATTG